MPRYVAMLRGVNIGSRNRIAMPALKEAFEKAGFSEVETYVRSGNIVFAADKKDDLDEYIHSLIQKQFGLDVPIIVRSGEELQQVVSGNPYLKRTGIDVDKLHVTFLGDKPQAGLLDTIKSPDDGRGDEFQLIGRDLFLHYPVDYGHTKMTNAYFEKKLKVGATTRNWNSITTLAKMAKG